VRFYPHQAIAGFPLKVYKYLPPLLRASHLDFILGVVRPLRISSGAYFYNSLFLSIGMKVAITLDFVITYKRSKVLMPLF